MHGDHHCLLKQVVGITQLSIETAAYVVRLEWTILKRLVVYGQHCLGPSWAANRRDIYGQLLRSGSSWGSCIKHNHSGMDFLHDILGEWCILVDNEPFNLALDLNFVEISDTVWLFLLHKCIGNTKTRIYRHAVAVLAEIWLNFCSFIQLSFECRHSPSFLCFRECLQIFICRDWALK